MATDNVKKYSSLVPDEYQANLIFLGQTGSTAYGVTTSSSDVDLFGVFVPTLDELFPHINGYIPGFGTQKKPKDCYVEHGIKMDCINVDLTLFSVVKFFNLAMENSPNVLEILYLDDYISLKPFDYVLRHRDLFPHQDGIYSKFLGYAYSQVKKLNCKDTKPAYHLARLLLQADQLLTTGEMSFKKNCEFLNDIRDGKHTTNNIYKWYTKMCQQLDDRKVSSVLKKHKDEKQIAELLHGCLSLCYGNEYYTIMNR